jgi:DNA primase
MACINSDVKDPDEFIRKFSPEAFRELPERNALEWLAVTELAEKGDTYTVLNDITPLIAQEKSPLARMRVINTIADMTGIDKLVISEEVDQKISLSKDRKGEFALKVIDEARELIIMNPGALGAAVNMISSKLDTLNANKNNEELFNSNETLKFLVKREEEQDSGEVAPIIKTGFSEFDEYIQLPTNEAFILVPGAANASKTTFLITLANNILDLNEDTIVIMHTIDDSRSIYFDRCVANRAGLHINWIKNPNFYLNDELKAKRKEAYRCVSDYIRDDLLSKM